MSLILNEILMNDIIEKTIKEEQKQPSQLDVFNLSFPVMFKYFRRRISYLKLLLDRCG